MSSCRFCGGTDLDYSEARGETFCTSCGAVLVESTMVESLQFAEASSGAKRMVGHIVSGSGAPNREATIQRGYQEIQRQATRLGIPLHLADSAQRIYLLAVQRSFTVGRQIPWVAAACLYIICRKEGSSQLLIDFSDVLQVPVRNLGAVFVKLLRVLSIRVPSVDPALYLARYAKSIPSISPEIRPQVVNTAERLVQVMNRNWIATGRRPQGLCGASLLISARFHGIKIHAADVSPIIRMSDHTVNKRINEFGRTSCASLPASELPTADLTALPTLPEPPCWGAAERRAEKRKKLLELPGPTEALPAPYYQLLKKPLPAILVDTDSPSGLRKMGEKILDALQDDPEAVTGELAGVAARDQAELLGDETDGGAVKGNKNDLGDKGNDETNLGDKDDSRVTSIVESIVESDFDDAKPESGLKSELMGLEAIFGDGECDPNNVMTLQAARDREDDSSSGVSETLSDTSDNEVSALILDDLEREAKTLMWDELTKSVMAHVTERRKRQAARRSTGIKKRKTTFEEAPTAADSIRLALESTKRVSEEEVDNLSSLFTVI